ncbi:MAG: type II toxin-antitoxin system prevent-host-death family antitoxin [Thermodesulfobacteriota bacterium]
MGIITAKELKQRTGEVIRKVKSGERLTVTYRGRPVAVIAPPEMEGRKALGELRPFKDAWRDIEESLERTKPRFKGWREAIEWVRGRI